MHIQSPDPDNNHARAITAQALALTKGARDAESTERAMSLYLEAASSGYSVAQYNLAAMHMSAKNFDEALVWFYKAADQGDVDAMFNIAYIADRGYINGQDLSTAFMWYERAAQGGSARGQYDLAAMYHHGRGINTDLELACHWYKKSWQGGVPRARINLLELGCEA